MFSKILTVTLNPSIDVTLWIDKLDLDEPVKCDNEKEYPGGKGINVSRVLTALSVDNTAIGITGKENKEKLSRLLDKENVQCDFIENDGAVRENFSIVLPNEKMLKINRKGFFVGNDVLDDLRNKVKSHIKGTQTPLLIFAGSLPKNVTKEQYKSLVMEFKKDGALIALDNDIFSVEDLKEISPYLIKPNRVEISHIFGVSNIENDDIKNYAQRLAEFTDHVLVSVGSKGLLYCNKNGCITVTVPQVKVKSTIGAGDTTLAGFVYALNNDKNIEYALRYAAASGTASVLLEGTDIITKTQAEQILEQVKIKNN